MPRWNLQRISHFLEVVEAKSLSQAAKKIGLSQPSLTSSIQKLESELGFELFDRRHGFELTALGSEFLPRARQTLGRIRDLEMEMEMVRRGDSGLIRVGCGPAMADGIVGIAIAEMIRRRPQLRIRVHVVPFTGLRLMLDTQEIDVAIGDRAITRNSDDYEVVAMPKHENLFFCRKDHPLSGVPRIGSKDFFKYPLVGQDLPVEAQAWLREHHPEGLAAEGLNLQCSHYALLKQVVSRTDAISAAPLEVIADELARGDMVALKTAMKPMMTQAVLVKLKHRRPTPATMELIRMLTAG